MVDNGTGVQSCRCSCSETITVPKRNDVELKNCVVKSKSKKE